MEEEKKLNNTPTNTIVPEADRLDVEKLSRGQLIGKIVSNTIIYLILILLAIAIIFPFYWMINSSL